MHLFIYGVHACARAHTRTPKILDDTDVRRETILSYVHYRIVNKLAYICVKCLMTISHYMNCGNVFTIFKPNY
jgi:hypothetical protein